MTDTEVQKGDEVSWSWGSGQPGGKVAEVKEQGEIAIESNRGNTIKKDASPDNPAVHIERSGNDVVKRVSELQVDKKADGADGQESNGDAKKEDDKPAETEKEEKPAESEKKDAEMADAPSTEEKKEDAQQNGESKDQADKGDATESKEDAKEDDKSADTAKTTKASEKKADASKTGSKRKAEDQPAEQANGDDATNEEPDSKKTKNDDDDAAEEPKSKKGGRPKGGAKKEKKEPAKKKQPKKAATADGEPRRSGRNKA